MLSLDTLPLEILFHVLSFAEPTCNPDPNLIRVPLNTLAATNKQLNAVVEEYARSLLKQHANFTPPKSSKTFTCRRKWLGEICQFCKKNSRRKACFYPTLTCCRSCDKACFPKMTMTQAMQDHKLSKLDLFTPNVLHPMLPRLATGSYAVMGGVANMISTGDALLRRDYIYNLLGDKAKDPFYMRRRIAAHQRITQHMLLEFDGGSWYEARNHKPSEKGPKSMHSEKSRKEYAQKVLEKQWAAMGIQNDGTSEDTAIELD
ncbi:hypothetical protein ACN47E_002698 [Coniothyrium glycines]